MAVAARRWKSRRQPQGGAGPKGGPHAPTAGGGQPHGGATPSGPKAGGSMYPIGPIGGGAAHSVNSGTRTGAGAGHKPGHTPPGGPQSQTPGAGRAGGIGPVVAQTGLPPGAGPKTRGGATAGKGGADGKPESDSSLPTPEADGPGGPGGTGGSGGESFSQERYNRFKPEPRQYFASSRKCWCFANHHSRCTRCS